MNAPNLFSNTKALTLRRVDVVALALFLCFAGNQFLFAQAGKSEDEDSYTIRGTVVNSVTHAPVGRALVYSADNRFAKLTDDRGHFEFKVPRPPDAPGLPSPSVMDTFSGPGVMQSRITFTGILFMARKPGYFDSLTRQQPMETDSAGSSEIRISLVPEALIIGHVNLPANDGTDKIHVEVYRRQVQEGRGHWVMQGTVSTRANGEFRFANLREGEYKLFTQELLDRDPLTYNPGGPLFGYPPVYYPSTADFESAAVIHLKAGQTFSAALTPSRREYYRVKLGVLNEPLAGGFGITIEPQGHLGPGYSLSYNADENTIEGMLPNGNYTLEVTKVGENGAAGVLNFSVNGAPLQGPTIMLVPSSSIEVRVSDERTKSQSPPETGLANLVRTMNVRLVPSDEFGPANPLSLQPPKNPEDESLVFGNAQPASYRVRAGCHPSAYVAAVSSGGRDLLRQALVVDLGAAIPPMEITIRDDGAQVHGSIENWPPKGQNGPVPAVVLMPLPDSSGLFCQAWVTPTGDFDLPQVPPGEYRVMAFDHLPEDLEYENSEATGRYGAKGQVLRLVAGQNEHLQLALSSGSE